ncbi:MAG: N-acetylglucosamine-6-phosphate deacetylase [Ruminococcaceae bacterium]|nr:N-acetylglucosamine-6-phosphate deacetylase [Oscillospiraceae bacterium]
MLIKNANVYNSDELCFKKIDIRIKNGIIAEMGELDALCDELLDASDSYIVPGLVDVHTHGRAGYDFLDADADLHKMARAYAERGVTTVMPTVASAPLDEMYGVAEKINSFVPMQGEASFCGVHIEGRYLNPDKRGAHSTDVISALDAEELDCDTLKSCRALHVSAAYELDSDGSFAKKAKKIGATLGLAHTSATYEQALAAERNGVTSYTHLFNAMPSLHHRDGGAVLAALMGDCFAEIICDGIHVCPDMVRFAYRLLGNERMSLISDSMSATGCKDGEYAIAGTPVRVVDGIARTPEGNLAGSTLTLDTALNNLIAFCGIPLEEALPCATANPAKQMGVYDECGSVDVGKRADLLFLDGREKLDITRIMINGRFI